MSTSENSGAWRSARIQARNDITSTDVSVPTTRFNTVKAKTPTSHDTSVRRYTNTIPHQDPAASLFSVPDKIDQEMDDFDYEDTMTRPEPPKRKRVSQDSKGNETSKKPRVQASRPPTEPSEALEEQQASDSGQTDPVTPTPAPAKKYTSAKKPAKIGGKSKQVRTLLSQTDLM